MGSARAGSNPAADVFYQRLSSLIMKRIQSAKSSPEHRLNQTKTQHKRFSLFIGSLSPSTSRAELQTKDAEGDLLAKLRRYRRNGKQVAFPRSPQAPVPDALKKGILVSKKSSRPNSSPAKHVSILQTARSIDTLPPTDPKFAYCEQQDADDRLFRGSRLAVSPRPETQFNPLFRFANVIDEKSKTQVMEEMEKQEREKHEKVVESIRVLKELTFELNLNYDTVHSQSESTDSSQLGAYYTLLEELQTSLSGSLDSLLGQSRSTFLEKLTKSTKFIRSLLRSLKSKGQFDECLLLELIWKLVIKLFDSAMEIHNHTVDEVVEMAKYRVRTEVEKRRKEVEELREKWEKEDAKWRETTRKLQASVEFLQAERTKLEHELADRQEELAKLTDFSTRENTVVEMQNLYKRMALYLSDVELEQTRQVAVLEGVEVILEAAKRLKQRPTTRSASVQSEDMWEYE